jgi:hypothetical protein
MPSRKQCRMVTPPALAREWGVGQGKILALIRAGELAAVDLAAPGCRRPRYSVAREAIDDFERRRRVIPTGVQHITRPVRRRGNDSIKEFV